MSKIYGSFSPRHNKKNSDTELRKVLNLPNGQYIFEVKLSNLDDAVVCESKRFSTLLLIEGEIRNRDKIREYFNKINFSTRGQNDYQMILLGLSLKGESFLKKISGEYALAFYNFIDKTLLLARGDLGQRLFYYHYAGGKLSFGSDLNQIISNSPEPIKCNNQWAYDYLVHGYYDNKKETCFENIYTLMPGNFLKFKPGAGKLVEQINFWQPEGIKLQKIDYQTAVKKTRDIFFENICSIVKNRKSVGVSLSGGIDSSSLACSIRSLYPNIKIDTFTYSIPQRHRLSENKWAKIVNKHIGANNHEISANKFDLFKDLNDLVKNQIQPFGSTSIYAQYLTFKLANQYKNDLVLTGQDGGTLFAGDVGCPGERILSLIEQKKYFQALKYSINWSKWPNRPYYRALLHLGQKTLPDSIYNLSRTALGREFKPAWLSEEFLNSVNTREERMRNLPEFKTRRCSELINYGLQIHPMPGYIRIITNNSKPFKIENGMPFVERNLAEFLASLPENFLVSDSGETKHILRDAMRGIVPDEILDRKDKIAFATQENEWMIGSRQKLASILDSTKDFEMFNSQELNMELGKYLSGRKKFSWQIWRWVNFITWYNLYINQ